MQKLLTPEFRQSLLSSEQEKTTEHTNPSSSSSANSAALLAAQWTIITRTLARVLGHTELYTTLLRELGQALQQPPTKQANQSAADQEDYSLPGLVFSSHAMHELARQIHKIRDSKLPVLITGEPGTGKEGVARAIHLLSDRRAGPFVAFNCTIVTKELMSSQLFGHRKGSFTGADSNYQGSIRSAEGGTIFLDEIGDLPLDLQPKLLRFLQDGEVHPVGETKPVKVNVRIVTATNRDLETMVSQGLFREDLYYRINILRFHLPPLRERSEEIPPLAFFLLERFGREAGKQSLTFSPTALARLCTTEWPGNIRQLSNQIQRAIALVGDEKVIQPHHLWAEVSSEGRKSKKRDWLDDLLQSLPTNSPIEENVVESDWSPRTHLRKTHGVRRTLAQEVDALEREILLETLEKLNGNLSKTAQELGLTRRGLSLKMNRLRIDAKMLKKATTQDVKPA